MNDFDQIVIYANDLLKSGLEHEQWAIRFAAAEAMADIDISLGEQVLKQGLHSENDFIRERAVIALGKLKKTKLQSCFEQAFEDESPVVRGRALEAMAAIKSPKLLSKLKQVLQKEHISTQKSAIEALNILAKKGESLLEQVATGKLACSYLLRLEASYHLSQRKNSMGRKVLYEVLDCEDSWVAFLSAEKLAKLGDDKGLSCLEEVLTWGDWPDKMKALEALVKLGKIEYAIEKLYRPDSAPDGIIRLEAAKIMYNISPEQSQELLIQSLDSSDEAIVIRTLEIIGEAGLSDLIDDVEYILIYAPEHLRAVAVMTIEKIGDRILLPYLIPVLERSHWLLRLQTAKVAIKLVG